MLVASGTIAPEYRLAREHPYPAALEDAHAVFAALRATSESHPIVVAGDSAGGHLALALQLAVRDRSEPGAAAAILISPWLDFAARRPSCRAHDRYDYGQTSFLLRHAHDVAAGRALEDPALSLIDADLRGLPPLSVHVGGAERLRDEGVKLVERAQSAGVEAVLELAEDMPHNPPVLADFHPEARRALERVVEQLMAHLPARAPSDDRSATRAVGGAALAPSSLSGGASGR